ncbi:MAG: hypothetical protein HQ512_04640 [Rhodospirillales bacterium]|nr:hypothetical protein [Rhodospirillales bacterium]
MRPPCACSDPPGSDRRSTQAHRFRFLGRFSFPRLDGVALVLSVLALAVFFLPFVLHVWEAGF